MFLFTNNSMFNVKIVQIFDLSTIDCGNIMLYLTLKILFN